MLGNSGRDPVREKKYAEQLWGAGVRGIIFGTSLFDFTHLDDLSGKACILLHLIDHLYEERECFIRQRIR